MLCSLVKAIKVYFLSTGLFNSSGTLYKDNVGNVVAVSYSLSAPQHKIDSGITVVKDAEYRPCFIKHTTPDYLLYTPQVSFKVKAWKEKTITPPIKGGYYPRHRINRVIRRHLHHYAKLHKPTPSVAPDARSHSNTTHSVPRSIVSVSKEVEPNTTPSSSPAPSPSPSPRPAPLVKNRA